MGQEVIGMTTEPEPYLGWRWTHFRTAMTKRGNHVTALAGNKGFPDLIAVRGPRCLFAELKREGGQLESEQAAWMAAIQGCRAHRCDCGTETYFGGGELPEFYLWRPSDWLSGEIARMLQ